MINLLYLTFGENIENHYQANFSILSFLKESQKINSITVITDRPMFYNRYKEKVDVIEVNEQMLSDWQGETRFFWRIKLKALELLAEKYVQGSIVYLDSDTFLYRSVDLLAEQIKMNTAFMHVMEGALSSLNTKTEKLMWEQVQGKKFGGVEITAQHAMWNAGVVILPSEKKTDAIKLALKICDDMCQAGVTRRLIEQFALSVALKEVYNLEAANSWIGHYWGNKAEWNAAIGRFFGDSHLKDISIQQEIAGMENFDLFSIAVRKRRSSMVTKLSKVIDRFFPVKSVEYINRNKI
jgi:hypothetical protein